MSRRLIALSLLLAAALSAAGVTGKRRGTILTEMANQTTVAASPKEGAELRFVLTVKSDTMEGDVIENGTLIGTARLTREK